MRVTIIPADGYVSVDGRGFNALDLSFIDTSVHAVQWYDDEGEVEIKDERGRAVRNEAIDSLEPYQQALDAWAVAKTNAKAADEAGVQ